MYPEMAKYYDYSNNSALNNSAFLVQQQTDKKVLNRYRINEKEREKLLMEEQVGFNRSKRILK